MYGLIPLLCPKPQEEKDRKYSKIACFQFTTFGELRNIGGKESLVQFLASFLLHIFLMSMRGSSHVGPQAQGCWKDSLEEKARQGGRDVSGLVCSRDTTPRAQGAHIFPVLHFVHSVPSEGCVVVKVEWVHQTLALSMCGVSDTAMKAMPVCAWRPILEWQYSLINLAMMRNAKLNSTEVKISPFYSDQIFLGCPSLFCLSNELEGPSLYQRFLTSVTHLVVGLTADFSNENASDMVMGRYHCLGSNNGFTSLQGL